VVTLTQLNYILDRAYEQFQQTPMAPRQFSSPVEFRTIVEDLAMGLTGDEDDDEDDDSALLVTPLINQRQTVELMRRVSKNIRKATDERTASQTFFPSMHQLFNTDMASSGKSESAELQRLLIEYRNDQRVAGDFRARINAEQNALAEREAARSLITRSLQQLLNTTLNLVTKRGILQSWNLLGVVISTSSGNTARNVYEAPLPNLVTANVAVRGAADLINVFDDELHPGTTLMYFVLARVKRSDGTYGAFQVMPVTCQDRKKPNTGTFTYPDLSGEAETPHVWYLSTPYHDQNTRDRERPMGGRQGAAGLLHELPQSSAMEMRGSLDIRRVLLGIQ
jgi:hypothetical protein